MERAELEQKLQALHARRHSQGGLSYAESFEMQQAQNELNVLEHNEPKPLEDLKVTVTADLSEIKGLIQTDRSLSEAEAAAIKANFERGARPDERNAILDEAGARYIPLSPLAPREHEDIDVTAFGGTSRVYARVAAHVPYGSAYDRLAMYPHRLSVKEARAIAGPSSGCTTA